MEKKNNEIDPVLDLKRGIFFEYILKRFIDDCISNFNKVIFNQKKKSYKNFNKSSFFMVLYIVFNL